MDKQYFNIVKARHIDKKGRMKGKEYTWNLPKHLRNGTSIGSLVKAQSDKGNVPVIVTRMYHDDTEDSVINHKKILRVVIKDYEDIVKRCIDLMGSVWYVKINKNTIKKFLVVGANKTRVIMDSGRRITLNELENKGVRIK